MVSIPECFSESYAEARTKFCSAAAASGRRDPLVAQPQRPRPERRGALPRHRALRPARRAQHAGADLGTHGVEGHCGSGAQIAWLRDRRRREAAQGYRGADVHAHQPARLRLDAARERGQRRPQPQLRRSRQGLSEERGLSRARRRRPAPRLERSVASAETERIFASYAQNHGAFGLQGAMSSGQYTHPDGIFFGGARPTWSNRTMRAIARDRAWQRAAGRRSSTSIPGSARSAMAS